MESSRQEKKIVKVVKSKKDQIKALRNNIEALLFHIIVVIIILGCLNIGLKCIGYDLIGKLPNRLETVTNYSIGISAIILGYWYMNNRILLENAK
jgi:uncharacterized membrane protein YuzA (DUF378 family)